MWVVEVQAAEAHRPSAGDCGCQAVRADFQRQETRVPTPRRERALDDELRWVPGDRLRQKGDHALG